MSNENTTNNKPRVNSKTRKRSFWIRTYIEPKHIRSWLQGEPWIQHWAYTTHDRCIDENGNIKTAHTHILLYTYDAKVSSAVQKKIDGLSRELYPGNPQQSRVEISTAPVFAFRYLLHRDNPEKVQYNNDERFTDDDSYWAKYEKTFGLNSPDNRALTIFIDIKRGAKTQELLERYGKDYLYHISCYKQAICDDNFENRAVTFVTNTEWYGRILQQDINCPFNEKQIKTFLNVLNYVETLDFLEYGKDKKNECY